MAEFPGGGAVVLCKYEVLRSKIFVECSRSWLARCDRRKFMRLNRFGIAVAATIGLAHSQSTTAAWPKFEVASIKPCKDLQPGARGGSGNSSPGRLNLNCQTVAGLIRFAY